MAECVPVSSFDTRAYWENRLGQDWSLQGVGFSRLGRRFNDWAYRLRGERFAELVEHYLPEHKSARVLDIGSGTGFYIDAWQRLGVREIIGMDLTDAAVANLKGAFPNVTFLRNDITEGIGDLAPESFDIVSCMDVMFHVVDTAKFAAAMDNVSSALRPGGHFVWSDFFVHGKEVVKNHIAWRSLYRVESILDHAGFDIVARKPLFFMMNEPRDTQSRVVLNGWKGLMWLASQSENAGEFVGRNLYRLDTKLNATRDESPSTEVMVCRKR
jgi:2-polyprenyl-3-methyl-5-hydroxy-6-metoxy-1,4-benzoquinol methylase